MTASMLAIWGMALVSRVEQSQVAGPDTARLLPKDRKEGWAFFSLWVSTCAHPTCAPDEQVECAARKDKNQKSKFEIVRRRDRVGGRKIEGANIWYQHIALAGPCSARRTVDRPTGRMKSPLGSARPDKQTTVHQTEGPNHPIHAARAAFWSQPGQVGVVSQAGGGGE